MSLSPSLLRERLYVIACGEASPLAQFVGASGIDLAAWQRVCHSPDVSLREHRFAVYLRVLPFMPRTFFYVPECRCCHAPAGNCQTHVVACPAPYVRSTYALLSVLDVLVLRMCARLVQHLDVSALLCTQVGTYHVIVAPDCDVPRLCRLHPSPEIEQLVVLTWSGLVWLHHTGRRHPLTVCVSLIEAMCTGVLCVMCMPRPFLVPLVQDLYAVQPRRMAPFSVALECPGCEELRAQQVATWLVRIDPRVHASTQLA